MFSDCLRVVPQDGYTALMKAAEKGHTEFGEMLVKAGADVNQKNVSHTHGGGVTVRGVGIGGMGG